MAAEPDKDTDSFPNLYKLTSGRLLERLHHYLASDGQRLRRTGPFFGAVEANVPVGPFTPIRQH